MRIQSIRVLRERARVYVPLKSGEEKNLPYYKVYCNGLWKSNGDGNRTYARAIVTVTVVVWPRIRDYVADVKALSEDQLITPASRTRDR